MLTCREISDLTTEYAEGALDADTRRRFEAHLSGCPACEAWVRQMQIAVRAASALPPPELPAALRAELLRRFDGWQAQRATPAPEPGSLAARARSSLPAALLLLAAAAVLALARHRSHAVQDWAIGLGLAGVGLALAAWLRRLTPGFVLAAAATALLAALARGRSGPLSALGGLDCILTEAGMALGAMGAAWLTLRKGASGSLRPALAAWAVAGVLVGDAALQIACADNASLPHLLVFHAGGVLAVIAAGWIRSRPVPAATW
ncbi:MAG: zf-HC2 domain-containing protein [Deltaproteobacteria bacterium]|nr:zf-HC2 domain-containing protein [Deltaproteobacteria bacterium]